jgi:ABC-type hemin transport system ATPase subunit
VSIPRRRRQSGGGAARVVLALVLAALWRPIVIQHVPRYVLA